MGTTDRRGFLKALAAATAAAAVGSFVDPEFLVWRPGARTIFLPDAKVSVPEVRLATGADMETLGRKSGKTGAQLDLLQQRQTELNRYERMSQDREAQMAGWRPRMVLNAPAYREAQQHSPQVFKMADVTLDTGRLRGSDLAAFQREAGVSLLLNDKKA